ncbi:hypothetical protein Ddye_027200 [Dipteronia dyeriana]|uniref:BED-type domain-containing protein n=1 Tax=Dipteronia dyeriana TaxID=168575 RepID=A0AAD9WR91_9ROSI|nr:hypothetical protein Ddye_027200 [Dipteronia dyeriana]
MDNVVNVEECSNQIRIADQEHYDFGSVNGKEKAICKYCKHAYVVGSGTKGLIDHHKTYKMRFGQRSIEPLFKPISRTTARRDIMSMNEIERAILLTMLGKIPGRIAITSDMWISSNQKRGYMTVTPQFIDSSWQLQSRLLS